MTGLPSFQQNTQKCWSVLENYARSAFDKNYQTANSLLPFFKINIVAHALYLNFQMTDALSVWLQVL